MSVLLKYLHGSLEKTRIRMGLLLESKTDELIEGWIVGWTVEWIERRLKKSQ